VKVVIKPKWSLMKRWGVTVLLQGVSPTMRMSSNCGALPLERKYTRSSLFTKPPHRQQRIKPHAHNAPGTVSESLGKVGIHSVIHCEALVLWVRHEPRVPPLGLCHQVVELGPLGVHVAHQHRKIRALLGLREQVQACLQLLLAHRTEFSLALQVRASDGDVLWPVHCRQ